MNKNRELFKSNTEGIQSLENSKDGGKRFGLKSKEESIGIVSEIYTNNSNVEVIASKNTVDEH